MSVPKQFLAHRQLLTNFREDMRVTYVVAAKEFGDIRMRVDAQATDAAPEGYGGSLWVEYPELREPDWEMISRFWSHFDKVRLRLGQFGMDALQELAKGLNHETG